MRVELHDTGAPRGERNYWQLKINGVVIGKGYGGREAPKKLRELYAALMQTLMDAKDLK